jgi:predicted enzyme related to lactoylglutathione lyase
MKTYPPGVPCWIDCAQPEPATAVDFYGGLFGWTFEDRGGYLIGSLDGAELLGIAAGDGPARWRTYVAVASADDTCAAAVAAGATVVDEPADVGPAGRTASLLDPTGAAIELWQPGARLGSAVVNAPGTWNWSNLHTPEVAAAERFYGDVFGWQSSGGMWMLPGYADAETRARHAEAGVPDGFSDAVAWVVVDPGPSRWHVTFAVDDPDARAARAVDLGGRVVAEPSDAGPTRLATLADPFGADFTVSHYNG